MKHTRKKRTRRIIKRRKTRNVSKRLGGVDYFEKDTPKVQLEKVLQLVRNTNLPDIIMDMKKNSPLIINTTMMSNLSYWNASQIMNNATYKTNDPDMRNIVYMINHKDSIHKLSNKKTWKKNINHAIFTNDFLKQAKDSRYGGPMIKTKVNKTFTLGELTILILQHRLDIMNWMEELDKKKEANALAKKKEANAREANARAAEEPPLLNQKNSTPEDWEDA